MLIKKAHTQPKRSKEKLKNKRQTFFQARGRFQKARRQLLYIINLVEVDKLGSTLRITRHGLLSDERSRHDTKITACKQ